MFLEEKVELKHSVLLSLHVHMALAQRLNELAAANSEGLLQYAPLI